MNVEGSEMQQNAGILRWDALMEENGSISMSKPDESFSDDWQSLGLGDDFGHVGRD